MGVQDVPFWGNCTLAHFGAEPHTKIIVKFTLAFSELISETFMPFMATVRWATLLQHRRPKLHVQCAFMSEPLFA